jgi:Holliday junction DNA helicase RuvA
MIASIVGVISSLQDKTVIVETASGIGYELFSTPESLRGKNIGDEIRLHTHLQIRDDAHVLFGFANGDEKRFFMILLSVPGVGPKTAFSIVCHLSFEDAVQAVRAQKVEVFSGISGIGKKTAMKIVLELSQLLKTDFKFEVQLSAEDKLVIDALISLGYSTKDAHQLFKKLTPSLSVEEKIQEALRVSALS